MLLKWIVCQVDPESRAGFSAAQEHWRSIAGSEGMLGGAFNRSLRSADQFLVATSWENESSHEHYAREKVPLLRAQASVAKDVERMVGRLVSIEDSWSVRPVRPPAP